MVESWTLTEACSSLDVVLGSLVTFRMSCRCTVFLGRQLLGRFTFVHTTGYLIFNFGITWDVLSLVAFPSVTHSPDSYYSRCLVFAYYFIIIYIYYNYFSHANMNRPLWHFFVSFTNLVFVPSSHCLVCHTSFHHPPNGNQHDRWKNCVGCLGQSAKALQSHLSPSLVQIFYLWHFGWWRCTK